MDINDEKLEPLIKLLQTGINQQEIEERVQEINSKLDWILELIAVRQLDAAKIADVHPQTLVNRAKAGDLSVLQCDGSRLNYFSLREIAGLKKRNKSDR